MATKRYQALISEDTMTMRSTDLHKFVYEVTGKFEKLKNFHAKIRDVIEKDSWKTQPTLKKNGQVEYYNLDEVECNMIMASIDLRYLRYISEIFSVVKNKRKSLTAMEILREQIDWNLAQEKLVQDAQKSADEANSRLDAVNHLIENNKSQEDKSPNA